MSTSITTLENRWADYYRAVAGQPPRDTLTKALTCFGSHPEGLAIDLGCGSGTDTIELLRRGWRVLAIDREPDALPWLQTTLAAEHHPQLETRIAAFEGLPLPAAQLINASYSLPFCDPAHYPTLWQTITTALLPGGRFAGHFFGERDGWATNPKMTFHTADQVRQLFSGFIIEFWREEEEDGVTAVGASKHWHVFSVVAQKA
jgi:SAM-dependent methyltransferase